MGRGICVCTVRSFFRLESRFWLRWGCSLDWRIGNDWINGLYYVTNIRYYNIQNYLYRLISDTQFLLSNSEGSVAAELLPSTSVKMVNTCVAILPMMCLFPFLSKYFRKGLTVGTVKG